MKIYGLKSASEYYESLRSNHSIEELMQLYAAHVAKKFAADCISRRSGQKGYVSDDLHRDVWLRYKSIIWSDKK